MQKIEFTNSPPDLQVEIIKDPLDQKIKQLAIAYATDYWAGSWQELLIEPNSKKQFGTYDQNGDIYPDTQIVLNQNNIQSDPGWPETLWQRAGARSIFIDGIPLKQFWTTESATETLKEFINPVSENGYNGRIVTFKKDDNIIGFTAYTVAEPNTGAKLVAKRFPYQDLDLESIVRNRFPAQRVGVFLDFAISENYRGNGFGSKLFDIRLAEMIKDGAEVIIGRTIKTSPAQYYGNYIARGMEPIAVDPTNSDKNIFAVKVNNIKPRKL